MHRSGTSMVAGSLASSGLYVGSDKDLLSDQDDNPTGFWERKDTVILNDKLLESKQATWFKPSSITEALAQDFSADVSAIVSDLDSSGGNWLLKDPRMAITWPAWKSAVGDAVLLFVYRDPASVAISLNRRNGFPLLLGLALWEVYNRAIVDALVGRDGVCVSFNSITNNPKTSLDEMFFQLEALGVPCMGSPEATIFDADLVRSTTAHQSSDSSANTAVAVSVGNVDSLLSSSQKQLANYCNALCAGSELPALPEPTEAVWAKIEDMAEAMTPLATAIETSNELGEMSRLCEERTQERDHTLEQLQGVERDHTALAEAHRNEIKQHRELEQQHRGLMQKHSELSDAHGQQLQQYGQLQQEHEVLTNKAEYLFTELTGTYAKLIDFRQSRLGSIWHVVGRAYKLLTRRRGTHTSYDDALADAHVHFERYELVNTDDIEEVTESPPGKLSMLGDVVKYVAKNPAGSARSFSLSRLKRATSVFIKSDPNDLDVWINARFPEKEGAAGQSVTIDPDNLDEALDQLELTFPALDDPHATVAVSIIIPVFNDYRMTMYCLQQLLENTSGVNYEVIIGDDCSDDLTASIADRVSNITVVRGEKNRGFLENCNAAAEAAKGKHVLFLNNDTGVCTNWLLPLVVVLEQDPTVGIVGPRLLFADGKLQEAGGIVWRDGSAWNYGRMDNPDKPEYSYLREVDYISGACLLVRGDLWQQLGGFDTLYKPAYYEDTDIAFEARAAGYKVVYQPASEIFHFEGVSNGTDLESGTKQYQVQNQQKFLDKWQQALESFHFPNAEHVFQARDRSRYKRCVLFIDHYVPHYDKDAGSRSTFMYVKLMLEMGYKVMFLGANYFPHNPYTETLQQLGVEVLVGEYMARNQDKWLQENAPYIDRIYLHRPHIAEQFLSSLEKMKPRPPVIFFGHDLHYLRISREEKILADPTLGKSSAKWKKREYAVFNRVDKIYYPSQVEVDEILHQQPELNVRAIPLYVIEQSAERTYDFASRSDILFVGGFNHPPNVDGICWFVEAVLPKVRQHCPEVQLHIVGSNPSDAVQDLQGEGVTVYGYLSDEELDALYQRVRQVVVPLRFGAGVKGKVLEAIQKNVPLVTTTVGAEGIPEAESVMNVADTAEGFADLVVRIDFGDAPALAKMGGYSEWLERNFSKEKAEAIILEDFGEPTMVAD